MFKKITIVGVGLIGGSIGLAAKRKKLARKIVGVCRREVSKKKALKYKAVGIATLDLKNAVKDADLVIIACPVGKVISLAETCIKSMKKGAILSDVASSKENIVRKIEKLAGEKVNFIGSHPMAGSDKSGVENASRDLFKSAALILTKTKKTNKNSLARLTKFWKNLGCRVFALSPEDHDRHISFASYLPHVVSYTLSGSQTDNSIKFAGGSLRDTTRVSQSDTDLWKDIFLFSKERTLKSIRVFSKNLKAFERALGRKDGKAIKKFLNRAKKIRGKIYGGQA